jgi:hypothetical protein
VSSTRAKFPRTVYPLLTLITFLSLASLLIRLLVRPFFIPFPLPPYDFFELEHSPLESRPPQVQENMLRQLALGVITRKAHLKYKGN